MITRPIVNVDWLQFFVDFSEFVVSAPYRYEVLDVHARTFAECGVLYKDGTPIAHIQRRPFSSIIKPTAGTFKIDNAILYNINAERIVDQIITDCGIWVLSLTRVDVCGDFQVIARRFPDRLIRDIMCGSILRVGQSRFYCRGEDLWHLDSVRPVSTKRNGKQTFCGVSSFEMLGSPSRADKFTYLRYGSKSSNVLVYLYNKSLELREVKDKRYIRECWRGADESRDVWRLEFSLKGRDAAYIARDTRFHVPRNWRLFFCPCLRSLFYLSLCDTYFDLRRNSGQVRKDREKRIVLFSGCPQVRFCREKIKAKPSDRADKVFLRKLDHLPGEIYDKSQQSLVVGAMFTGEEYARVKGLDRWCAENGIDFGVKRRQVLANEFSEVVFGDDV